MLCCVCEQTQPWRPEKVMTSRSLVASYRLSMLQTEFNALFSALYLCPRYLKLLISSSSIPSQVLMVTFFLLLLLNSMSFVLPAFILMHTFPTGSSILGLLYSLRQLLACLLTCLLACLLPPLMALHTFVFCIIAVLTLLTSKPVSCVITSM